MGVYLDSALLGLQYALLALGVTITFRVLNTPDLTVDGSFVTGIAVSGVLTAAGHPVLGLLLSAPAGAAAGCITGFLQTKAGIHPILSGILTMSDLYTVHITILGGPNLSLLNHRKFFTAAVETIPADKTLVKGVILLLICALAITLLFLFFRTVAGLSIRATGNNEEMVRVSSINTDAMKVLALAISNALVAFSGGLLAQFQGFSDINSGSGMIVIGLASVIIGEVIFGRRSLTLGLISAVAGSVIYRLILPLALQYSFLSANALKLVSAVIVAATLSVPAVKKAIAKRRIRLEASKC